MVVGLEYEVHFYHMRTIILLFQDLFVTLQIESWNIKRLHYGYQEED